MNHALRPSTDPRWDWDVMQGDKLVTSLCAPRPMALNICAILDRDGSTLNSPYGEVDEIADAIILAQAARPESRL